LNDWNKFKLWLNFNAGWDPHPTLPVEKHTQYAQEKFETLLGYQNNYSSAIFCYGVKGESASRALFKLWKML
jgi:hypothetical protein